MGSHVAERGFEALARGFALAQYALHNKQIIHSDLTDGSMIQGVDLQMIGKTLSSSVHIPVIWEGRPATVNFWSKQKNAFTDENVPILEAVAKLVAAK
jgi:hypothetical protein